MLGGAHLASAMPVRSVMSIAVIGEATAFDNQHRRNRHAAASRYFICMKPVSFYRRL